MHRPVLWYRYRNGRVFDSFFWVLVFVAVAASRGFAEDWPTWRQNSLRTAVTNERLELPLKKGWEFRARQSHRAPQPAHGPLQAEYPFCTWFTLPISSAGERLFFNSAADGRTVCLDAASGQIKWQFFGGAAMNRTPTCWKGKVYVASDDGHAYCLNADTGEPIWKFQAAPADRWMLSYGKPVSAWPVRTDVAVDNGVAYFGAGVFPHDGTFMYAVDADSGELRWRNGTQCETGDRISMSPAGHLYVTKDCLFTPKDCWGYFTGWLTLVSFDRHTGGPVKTPPSKDEWPGYPGLAGPLRPLLGVKHKGVQYYGNYAAKIHPEDLNKQTQLWREDTPGRCTDLDSVLSVRPKRAPVVYRWDPDLTSVVYAGDVVYHTAFDTDPAKGIGTGIYARDPQTGKVLWSVDVPERANQIIVANGRLFASTRRGTIYCFASQTADTHVIDEKASSDCAIAEEATPIEKKIAAADAILKLSGKTAGYAVVADCGSGRLALELARQSDLYVIALHDNEASAAAARRLFAAHDLHVSRMVALHQQPGERLPFPDYFADLVVSEAALGGGELPANREELQRLVKPMRGLAIIGGEQTDAALIKWKGDDWKVVASGDLRFARWDRPRLAGAGGWFTPHADAGHTNCSHDGVLKPPLGVVWYGNPQLKAGSGAPAGLSIITEGVFFVYKDDGIAAYDQYTGRQLWTRGNSRTDMVGAPGSLFLRYLEVIARFEPATGEFLGEYLPPFTDGKWTMMAPSAEGDVLFAAAEAKDAEGKIVWRAIQAIKVDTGKRLWTLGGPEAEKQWGPWSAIGDGFMMGWLEGASDQIKQATIDEMQEYLQAHDLDALKVFQANLDKHDFRQFTAIDTYTGKVLYTRGVDLTNCGGGWFPNTGYGSKRHYNPYVLGCTMAHRDAVVFCTASGADKGWGLWPGGAYKQRAIAVHHGPTGKLLWKKAANYRTRPVIVDGNIYAEPWAYDLHTGERKTRIHPITGELADWAWCRAGKQCGMFCASKHFLFGRSTGVGYHDLLTDQGLYTFFHSRMSCSFDAVSGGGCMIKPPMAVYCRCSWSLPFTVALAKVPATPTVGQLFAQPGATLPVKHLSIDFGGTGDRRDDSGTLWLRPDRPVGHPLILGHEIKIEKYQGGTEVRRNSQYTEIENADPPFVYATAVAGIKKCVIPVRRPNDGTATYRVRLGFAAPKSDQPGSRVFDVSINGSVLLKDFDIAKEAGGTDKAIWREFDLEVADQLELHFRVADDSAAAQLPILCAAQLLLRE